MRFECQQFHLQKCLAMLLLLLIPIERVDFSSPFRLINPHVAFSAYRHRVCHVREVGIMSYMVSIFYFILKSFVNYLLRYKTQSPRRKATKLLHFINVQFLFYLI